MARTTDKSQLGSSNARDAPLEIEVHHHLPRSRAAIYVQCARFDTPDNIRACPEVHRLAGGPKRLTWYEDDHNFTSFEAMRDRLYWLDASLKIGGVAKVLARLTKPKRESALPASHSRR